MASLVTNLLSGGLLSGISSVINSIRGKSPEDAAKLAELLETHKHEFEMADIELAKGQQAINQAEATNTSIFVAGWRPFIGWICGTGLGVQFIVNPVVTWIATLAHHPVTFPSLDLGTLMTCLLGMLGLGAMRSYEKVSGVNAGH